MWFLFDIFKLPLFSVECDKSFILLRFDFFFALSSRQLTSVILYPCKQLHNKWLRVCKLLFSKSYTWRNNITNISFSNKSFFFFFSITTCVRMPPPLHLLCVPSDLFAAHIHSFTVWKYKSKPKIIEHISFVLWQRGQKKFWLFFAVCTRFDRHMNTNFMISCNIIQWWLTSIYINNKLLVLIIQESKKNIYSLFISVGVENVQITWN